MFQQDAGHLGASARDTVAFLERERDARNASSSTLGACVRVHEAHFEHEILTVLSRSVMTTNKYPVYCVLIQSSDTLLRIIHFNVM